eukprot:COSAG02_NODE_2728_length_8148_cov_19.461921_2_plen_64_part_00
MWDVRMLGHARTHAPRVQARASAFRMFFFIMALGWLLVGEVLVGEVLVGVRLYVCRQRSFFCR